MIRSVAVTYDLVFQLPLWPISYLDHQGGAEMEGIIIQNYNSYGGTNGTHNAKSRKDEKISIGSSSSNYIHMREKMII